MADDGLASVLIREAERPPKTIANRTWNRRVEFGAALATPICETDLSCFQFSLHTSRCACGVQHCTAGLGIWEWASSDEGGEPDVLMACAGDVPTMETLAAVELLRQHFSALKIHVMALYPQSVHPHGLSNMDFDVLFTTESRSSSPTTGFPL